jgi:lysine 2,3-aminomutase
MRFCLDTPIGKVRRENIVGWDRERGVVTFERDGKRVSYPDFPAALDVPGDPTVMLWRG